jgi:hypothetical protein
MSVIQHMKTEREARRLIADLGQLNRKYLDLRAQARGDRPARRVCTCRPCLMMWAPRILAVVGLAVDLYIAHRFGWI